MIGLKYSRHLLNQSDAKPITTWSCALSRLRVFTLWSAIVVALVLVCQPLYSSVNNVQRFTTKIIKCFYRFQCLKRLAMLHYQGLMILKLISCEILYVWVNTAAIEEQTLMMRKILFCQWHKLLGKKKFPSSLCHWQNNIFLIFLPSLNIPSFLSTNFDDVSSLCFQSSVCNDSLRDPD